MAAEEAARGTETKKGKALGYLRAKLENREKNK